jgi:hypothetical protein
MKKWMLAFALTLAFSLVAVAQSDSGSSASGSQTSSGSTASTPGQSSSGSTSSTGSMGTSSTSSTDKSSASSTSGKSEHLTGCLEQGSTPGTYMLKDSKHPEGVQLSYSGSEDLSKHVGHKVKVTGSMSGDTLNATNVKHISETCSVGSASSGKHHHDKASGSSSDMGTSGTSTSGSSTANPGTSSNPK